MVELAKRHMPDGVLYDAVSETAHCLPDAVQLLTPCTFGNGWLRVLPFGIYAVTLYDKATGEGVRVELDNDKLEPYDAIRSWFLKERPKPPPWPSITTTNGASFFIQDPLFPSSITLTPVVDSRSSFF